MLIPYGRHDISSSDIDAVVSVLKSDNLTQGPVVPLFEATLADFVGAKYAVAVNSATSALHIACLALDLGQGDWLWTTPITFVASANCGLYCGAQVDFVDIDLRTYNICSDSLEKKLQIAAKEDALPKVVVVVHLCGQPCDMAEIYALSKRYGFKIIEDASHAIGAKYQDKLIGDCSYSDITIFSFHPVKIITAGEGGVALTNSEDLARKMILFRSHGITRDEAAMNRKSDGPWYYEQICLGYNYRMTDILAALGLSQLKRLGDNISQRHVLARRYDQMLSALPLLVPFHSHDRRSAMHLYVVCLKLDQIKKTRLDIFNELRKRKIGVNIHYIPVHTQPYYRNLGFDWGDFPKSEAYYSAAISLPMFHSLSHEEQDRVVIALEETLSL
jgi:UDP-4-amino-4,6-dideoxy-N-acetyl-beta-L-altrosamine transaminase